MHSFSGDDPIQCKDYVREKLGMPSWQPSKATGTTMIPLSRSYIYCKADGTPYLRVQRTAAKRFWQQQWNGTGWEKGAPKGERIPYRLPELLAADPSDPVYIVEGEKDADRLASLGFVVTTSSGGSNGKWPELNEPFANRTIYIIPDNDEPGHKYAQRVAQHLHGIAAKVAIVELPGLGERAADHGPDVSDWLDTGQPAREPWLHRGAGTGVDATDTEGRLACSRIPGGIAEGKEVRCRYLMSCRNSFPRVSPFSPASRRSANHGWRSILRLPWPVGALSWAIFTL